jgi:dTMP kinase
MSRGAFVVVEGLDGAGKSTLISALSSALADRGLPSEALHFPDRSTPIGHVCDLYLRKKLPDFDDFKAHMAFADNRKELQDMMLEKLHAGTSLIASRYAFSGVAFSAQKHLPSLDFETCLHADDHIIAPDLVLYLYGDPETFSQRSKTYGEEIYEAVDIQHRVADEFERLASRVPACSRWTPVSGLLGPEQLTQVAQDLVSELLPQLVGAPVYRLWDGEVFDAAGLPAPTTSTMPADIE